MYVEEGIFTLSCIVRLAALVQIVYGEYERYVWDDMLIKERRFAKWRLSNPGVCVGFSPEGRRIVGAYLEAHQRFMQVFKFMDVPWCIELLEFLEQLLNELPRPPEARCTPCAYKSPITGALILYQY